MSLSTDVAALAAACRRCLGNGTSFTGAEIRLCIDTLETLANTTESKGATTATAAAAADVALAAAIVTMFTAWAGVGAGDSAAIYAAQEAIVTPLKVAAVAASAAAATAAAASVTNVTVNDSTDGRAV